MDQRTPAAPAVSAAPLVTAATAAALALFLLVGCTADAAEHGTRGAAGVGDRYFPRLGNGGYDVQHYGLELDYVPSTGRLKGTAAITARATQDLSAFNLDFAGMTVDSVTVGGKKATVHRAGTELTLRPRAVLSRGDTFRTVVRYAGVPRRITDPDESHEGWLRKGDRAVGLGEPTGSMAWFPGNHHPSDKASYDIRITVPEGVKAISNGELRSERTSAGRTAFAWHSAEPMASYLATVAIGPYKTNEVKGKKGTKGVKVTEGAKAAKVPKSAKTPKGQAAVPVVPLYTAVDPTAAEDGAELLAELPGIIEWETKTFGPYPFSSAGVIIGREDDSEYALETQTKPFLPGPTSVGTLVHEVAHQWFGNSVTPKSWQDMWLNEGFAEYAEWLWEEHSDDIPVQQSFDEAYGDDDNWAFPPGRPPSAANISDSPVYGRGAMVLHRVRVAVGDEAFFRIVRGWLRTHRHGNVSTDDFTAYVEKESGQDLRGVWDAWLYGDSKPTVV
ncbi:M1 family metallopeptidase [Streptomyces sp. NPDC088400]|uniref:M1 family metallopeptidase n=1 Tax=Streptomyces sp. NPDC088400 TaxID=3365861 RepID=UPI0038077AC6